MTRSIPWRRFPPFQLFSSSRPRPLRDTAFNECFQPAVIQHFYWRSHRLNTGKTDIRNPFVPRYTLVYACRSTLYIPLPPPLILVARPPLCLRFSSDFHCLNPTERTFLQLSARNYRVTIHLEAINLPRTPSFLISTTREITRECRNIPGHGTSK